MNCREFRRKHDAYVDDTLSGVEIDAMSSHRRFCERCAKLDTRVRRALLVAHNLPPIQPSADFTAKLQARLIHERKLMAAGGGVGRLDGFDARQSPLTTNAYATVAAGLLLAAGLALTVAMHGGEPPMIRLAPVVATLPEPDPSVLAPSTMVASMPAGMTMWPAVFVAQQAPWHFASDAVGGR